MILCTHRKQFSQTCQKVFARRPNVFRWLVKTVRTPAIFFRKLIFFQGFRWTCGILFWQSCWNSFNKKLRKFAQKTKIIKKYDFSKKNSIKLFLGHVEYSFHSRTLFARHPKRTGKSFFLHKFSSNFIYLEVKCTFLDRPEKRLPEGPVFSCQSPQKNWKFTWIFRNYFSSKFTYGHVEYTIDNPIEKNWQLAEFFSLSVRRRKKQFKNFPGK